jgi:hypothetical protein
MRTANLKRNFIPFFLRFFFFISFVVLIVKHQSFHFIEHYFSTEQTDLQNESNPSEPSLELMQDMENNLVLHYYNITQVPNFEPLINLVFKQIDTEHLSKPFYDIIGPPPKI